MSKKRAKLPNVLVVIVTMIIAVLAYVVESGQLAGPGQQQSGQAGAPQVNQETDEEVAPETLQPSSPESVNVSAAEQIIQQAFQQQRSDVAVQGQAVVKKVLPDDNKGSRHQRFIIHFPQGQTVLIAHNIDLAPRVENVQAGGVIGFKGDYEYSPQGGVIHWTHRDPQGRHVDGWLQYQGRTYQ